MLNFHQILLLNTLNTYYLMLFGVQCTYKGKNVLLDILKTTFSI